MIYINSYGVIPFRQEAGQRQVLLVLHKEGYHWGFPKGRGNAGESPLDSAKRELFEETGLSIVQLLTEDPVIEKYDFCRKRKMISKTVEYFPAVVSGELRLQPEEIREGRWCSVGEALSLLTFQEARNLLQATIKRLETK